jgi:hypothetical protein
MRKRISVALALGVILMAVLVQADARRAHAPRRTNAALQRALAKGGSIQRLPNGALVPAISGGVVTSAREALAARSGRVAARAARGFNPDIDARTAGCPNVFRKHGYPDNIRANQDCSLRRQAEIQVAVNPTSASNIILGQNDSRVGFNQTGLDWTINGGRNWGDYSIPTRFLNCATGAYDAFSDPSQAFAGDGTLGYVAVAFNLATPTGGLYYWEGGEKGTSLHAPGNPLSATPTTIYDNCADPTKSPDKQFVAVDTSGGAHDGNIYVTFTLFGSDDVGNYLESPIFLGRSTDGGLSWDPVKRISGRSSSLCVAGDAFDPGINPTECNFDQGSWPVVAPDGSVNVVFNNCNTESAKGDYGVCQQLFVKSTDGGSHWSSPAKVADDFGLQPIQTGSLPNGCDPGRQCLPPNGYRMNDFPSMGVADKSGKLAVFWSDFRNGCNPQFGCTGTPNSNNDVFAAISTDGGAHWGPTKIVDDNKAAQWQGWGDVGEDGRLYVAYYDRRYGNAEKTGANDITLSVSSNNGRTWRNRRITTRSMPNLTPSNNPVQFGFLGDYMGLVVANGWVHIGWSDTRGLEGNVEEDAYYARVRA